MGKTEFLWLADECPDCALRAFEAPALFSAGCLERRWRAVGMASRAAGTGCRPADFARLCTATLGAGFRDG